LSTRGGGPQAVAAMFPFGSIPLPIFRRARWQIQNTKIQ
jgi:hypothetical protein